MAFSNRLIRSLAKLEAFPKGLQRPMRNWVIGRTVPFTGTAGIDYEKMSREEVILNLRNRKKVQNHIQQVHAAATALLAETASGMVVGMNLPDDKLPLIKSMQVRYTKRSTGAQRAVASLSDEQVQHIHNTEKGDVLVPVSIHDETGAKVVELEMLWAWIPKKKKE